MILIDLTRQSQASESRRAYLPTYLLACLPTYVAYLHTRQQIAAGRSRVPGFVGELFACRSGATTRRRPLLVFSCLALHAPPRIPRTNLEKSYKAFILSRHSNHKFEKVLKFLAKIPSTDCIAYASASHCVAWGKWARQKHAEFFLLLPAGRSAGRVKELAVFYLYTSKLAVSFSGRFFLSPYLSQAYRYMPICLQDFRSAERYERWGEAVY
jgi:hypothetical protein